MPSEKYRLEVERDTLFRAIVDRLTFSQYQKWTPSLQYRDRFADVARVTRDKHLRTLADRGLEICKQLGY